MKKVLVSFLVVLAISASAQQAEKIVDQHFEAIGGYKNLAKIKSIFQKGKMVVSGMEMPYESYQSVDGKMYVKMNMMGTDMIALAFDGKNGFKMNRSMGYEDIADKDKESIMENAKNLFGALYQYKEKKHQLKYMKTEDVDGVTYDVVKVNTEKPIKGIDEFIFFFNAKTHLMERFEADKDGMKVITKITEYKDVDGYKFPTHTLIEVKGMPGSQEVIFDEIKINPPAPDASVYKKPIK